ncbi:MAG: molybdopterin-binding protein [Chloroflexota bacterium]
MKAEILSVGSELLRGTTADTNGPYLADSLFRLGIELHYISIVGDDRQRLAEAIGQAWKRSDLTLLTGGLGPTEDDLPREAIAQAMGEEMRIDTALEQWLRQVFTSRRMSMPERNLKQAMLIPSAQAMDNLLGTAPGWWVERDGKLLISMPGPPREMERMWQSEVLLLLQPRVGGVIVSSTLKTYGLGEAAVDEALAPIRASSNPVIGIYDKGDGIHITLTARAPTRTQAGQMLSQMEAQAIMPVNVCPFFTCW